MPENRVSKTRSGLGKGLGSLIPSADAESGVNIDFTEIPIDRITPNPDQPRIDFAEEKMLELQESIRKDGLLQPIIVRPEGAGYQIIAGERRWQACKRNGFPTIAAKIVIANDIESQEISLVENLQRDNLNAIEEARGYQRLMEISGNKQKDIAVAVSKNQATISNALRLLSLPEDVQALMFEGQLSAGHGRAILAVPDDEGRIRLANKVVNENLSVRDTEALARLYGTQGLEHGRRQPSPRAFKIVARKLRQQLATAVRVKTVRGRHRIEIEFKDEADLQRIYDLLDNSHQDVPGTTSSNWSSGVESEVWDEQDPTVISG